jgi:Matrixin
MRTTAALILLLVLPPLQARAFVCLKAADGTCVHWGQGHATIVSFLGGPVQLSNGTTSWDQNAINAANDWNGTGAAFHFNVSAGGTLNEPCGSAGPGHACTGTGPAGDNPVLFRNNVCGAAFGPDIIELTQTCWNGNGTMINAPVFINSAVLWNAYDGPIQFTASGQPVNDIRRVLLHEFGHVLGLRNPDQAGQTVQAIMNSQESNLDRLQSDDIAGALFLYPNTGATGTPTVTPTFTPKPCVGDCNSDRHVTVDEILTMVNIALGNTAVTACEAGDANHDGQITVDEILTAVNNALSGCVPFPSPTAGPQQVCVNSGGAVSTALCCLGVGDFPNTCGIGACGCSPTSSHEVQVCTCASGKCFGGAGVGCVTH